MIDINAAGEMVFYRYWKDGKIVIIGRLAEGPMAGQQVACVTDRGNFIRGVREAKDALNRPQFLASLRASIKAQIAKGTASLIPGTSNDFMNDLGVMMACKVATGDESLLNDSGLFSLMIAIDPDTKAPWHRRGLLAPGEPTGMVEP